MSRIFRINIQFPFHTNWKRSDTDNLFLSLSEDFNQELTFWSTWIKNSLTRFFSSGRRIQNCQKLCTSLELLIMSMCARTLTLNSCPLCLLWGLKQYSVTSYISLPMQYKSISSLQFEKSQNSLFRNPRN